MLHTIKIKRIKYYYHNATVRTDWLLIITAFALCAGVDITFNLMNLWL